MIKMRLVILLLALSLPSPVSAGQNTRTIHWEDLVPKMAPMENPFKTLTTDQLSDLQNLLWIRDTKRENLKSAVDNILEEGAKNRLRLSRQGLDVDELMAVFDRFEREVDKRNQATNAKLDGKMIRIPGYALPLEHIETGVKELLLVPYVGACIHVPPPPANQTIYVILKDPYIANNLYEAVWITGYLSLETAKKSLSFVDGSANVDVAYTLEGVNVIPYRD